MSRTSRSSTEGAGKAILGAAFWSKGKSVTGVFTRTWDSANGPMFDFIVIPGTEKPIANLDANGRVTEDGDASGKPIPLEKFSMGNLKGWVMALEDNDLYPLQIRDTIKITCSGIQKSLDRGKDDMVQFEIELTR